MKKFLEQKKLFKIGTCLAIAIHAMESDEKKLNHKILLKNEKASK